MAITTTNEISTPVDVDFQVNLLRNAKAHAPYFMGTVPAEVAEHMGTFTAKWRRIENLTPTTTALAEITGSVSFPTRTGSQPSVTDVTATLSKYGDFMYLSEEVDLGNFNGQNEKLSEILGIQAGSSLNRLQRNVAEDNLTIVLAGTGTTATTVGNQATFTRADAQDVVNTLQRNDALKFTPMTVGDPDTGTTPIRPGFWGVCHYDTEDDLRLLTGFNSAETYAGQTQMARGEFGQIDGIRFISTSEGSIDLAAGATVTGSATSDGRSSGSTSYDLYNTVIYGRDCLGSLGFGEEHIQEAYEVGDSLPAVMPITHARGSGGVADPLNEISTLGWKTWHAGVVLNGNWGRTVRHLSSRIKSAK